MYIKERYGADSWQINQLWRDRRNEGMGMDGMKAVLPVFVPLPHHDAHKYLR